MADELGRGVTDSGRRGVLASLLMGAGLIAGYGQGFLHFIRYLVPGRRRDRRREMFIGTLETIPVGASRTVRDPRGQEIAVARTSESRSDPRAGFKALSSKCPHLGCKVHYVPGRQEFFCPCHNGVFDRDGVALSGPPFKEGKNLTTFEVRVDERNGAVFVLVTPEFTYGLGA